MYQAHVSWAVVDCNLYICILTLDSSCARDAEALLIVLIDSPPTLVTTFGVVLEK